MLIEEGRNWNILDSLIGVDVPVRILQGGLDPDVPWTHSLDLADKLRSQDVVWSLIKDGDHRLSRPEDIERMVTTVLALADQIDAAR
jgi:dipeptidyl aminopeptidase/acylaminoacyl peptidase